MLLLLLLLHFHFACVLTFETLKCLIPTKLRVLRGMTMAVLVNSVGILGNRVFLIGGSLGRGRSGTPVIENSGWEADPVMGLGRWTRIRPIRPESLGRLVEPNSNRSTGLYRLCHNLCLRFRPIFHWLGDRSQRVRLVLSDHPTKQSHPRRGGKAFLFFCWEKRKKKTETCLFVCLVKIGGWFGFSLYHVIKQSFVWFFCLCYYS